MLNGKKVLAVIPARGGSKRLPGKNIKIFQGKPLIVWTIDAALKCEYIDKVIVNSDSDKILAASRLPNVVLDKRRLELATDTSTSIDVALDVLDRFPGFDILVWLQPTSPLRTAIHISEALGKYRELGASSIASVCSVDHSPQWINELDSNGGLSKFYSAETVNKRSQDLGEFVQLNGAIYINEIADLYQEKSFLSKKTLAYVMSREQSVDIDSMLEFRFAEFLFDYV